MENSAILPLFYLPPVAYFTVMRELDYDFYIEMHEHFPKQTYRNRASVYSPNGVLDLSIPIIKGSKVHTQMKDVKISNEFNWQRLHWKTLESCYRNSPYFEYYEDELLPFYTKKYTHLFEFNIELLQWLLKQIKQQIDFQFTKEYVKEIDSQMDYRHRWRVSFREHELSRTYMQVFDDRQGFKANLSMVDLLFNQGPQAKLYF